MSNDSFQDRDSLVLGNDDEEDDSGGSTLLSEEVMAHFKQLSRVVHFVLTPLLFLPKWRFEAHATR